MPRITVIRDLSLLALTGFLWWQDSLSRGMGGFRALTVATLAGVFAGIAGFLLHEWGHLFAALAAGSRVHYPNRILAPLLFHFDSGLNDRRQFLWMSYGGYLASAVGVVAIAWLAPLNVWSGRLALGLAGLGLIVTFIAEIPITVRVLRGAPLPDGYAYKPPLR